MNYSDVRWVFYHIGDLKDFLKNSKEFNRLPDQWQYLKHLTWYCFMFRSELNKFNSHCETRGQSWFTQGSYKYRHEDVRLSVSSMQGSRMLRSHFRQRVKKRLHIVWVTRQVEETSCVYNSSSKDVVVLKSFILIEVLVISRKDCEVNQCKCFSSR